MPDLPQPLTSFVGRQYELDELGVLLGRHRLVTVVGTGGCGKTRLAIELARQQPETAAGRTWFVDLGSLGGPELLPELVASVVGIQPAGGEEVVELLGRKLDGGPTLLILDTCEHLVAACADLIGRLLLRCPLLKVLATSRQALGVSGEVRWTVPSLAFPADDREWSPDALRELESIQLFIDRARLNHPAFALSNDNAVAVAAICRLLDGIPLAIELATAWTRVLSPDQIVSRMDSRFSFLRGARDATPRHRTLEAAVQWSHDLLDPAEQVLLRRLSVFSGSFGLERCIEVCSDAPVPAGELVHPLAGLADKSMVEVQSGGGRYRLLDTIRQYAEARLEAAGETSEMERRHAHCYLELAEAAYRNLRGPARLEWQTRLEAEATNLRKALDWTNSNDPENAVRLGYLLAPFHMVRMAGADVKQADRWLERALAGHESSRGVRGWALALRGWLAWRQGDVAAAETHWNGALQIFRDIDDAKGLGEMLTQVGEIAGARGDIARAKRLLEDGFRQSLAAGDDWTAAYAQFYLGLLEVRRGNPGGALDLLNDSLAGWRRLGDQLMTAYPIAVLGFAALELGDLATARDRLNEALGISQDHRYEWGNAVLMQLFAALCVGLRDPSRALMLLGAAEAAFERISSAQSPFMLPAVQPWLARARRALPEEEAQGLIRRGRSMAAGEAIELVRSIPSGRQNRAGGLSPREAQIAELVAVGLGTKEIAARLRISPRTAETHVDHIRIKLGLKSRAQIAAWAVHQGLVVRPR